MSFQLTRHNATLGIATLAAVSVAIAGLTAWWKKKQARGRIPSKWKRVGEIMEIYCFPIKSCGVIRLTEGQCTTLGLQNGMLRDRVFMVTDLKNNFVTGRAYPKMTQIRPSINEAIFSLEAPGMLSICIDMKQLTQGKLITAKVWGQPVKAVDCGEEAATWFSRCLLGEETGLRLVYFPSAAPCRPVRQNNAVFETILEEDSGALPDATSFSLLSESSVADLNRRLEKEVTALQFRPNFVVRGTYSPYEEEDWEWIQIGEAVFRNIKPCTRCVFTTVDPYNGQKDPGMQPLKELRSYKLIMDEKLRPFTGESPVMGIHLGLRKHGMVKVGDPVYAGVS
ncbi:mitochondrial amidoxime reducing component 2-like [Ischnura elegans]|uniref:mitochondrial amidoxime reducing component 2-like n=1 Tax=Ischnura elegans TaxID=197161 RepID=UPI001ED8AEFF|nr:mitochondrial amidoxime reducing component 2-like [Ischnura elegans]